MTTILCIDDEPDMLDILATEIDSAGYHVIVAEGGRAGLEAILTNSPDLVVCDIRMPGLDGYGLLTELRLYHEGHAWTPFIFLSGLTDRADIIRGKALGADDYITKPVDIELLLATIAARIGQVRRMKSSRDQDLVRLYSKLTSAAINLAPSDPAPDDTQATRHRPAPTVTATATGRHMIAACSAADQIPPLQHAADLAGLGFFGTTSGQQAIEYAENIPQEGLPEPAIAFVSYITDDLPAQLIARTLRRQHPKMRLVFMVPPELGVVPDADRLENFDVAITFPCNDSDLRRALEI